MKIRKYVVVTIIVTILAIGMFALYRNKEKIKGHIYLNVIDYDMTIDYVDGKESLITGGYANIYQYRRVDTKKKMLYIIEDYYVWSPGARGAEKGSHYTLEKVKLTEKQVNKLINYATGESTYDISQRELLDSYVEITYNGQTKYYQYKDFKY